MFTFRPQRIDILAPRSNEQEGLAVYPGKGDAIMVFISQWVRESGRNTNFNEVKECHASNWDDNRL
ncbi:MAG: hypothetical protein A2X82_13730 [Geobacteraceae bacterium GWC2_55_20]|nr:MAG: hypothetical protein A2X82_13730 [Geobacteraceae bacterium GWC2_55_20]OGU20401.1 MAG: hypothetical protein A2X85_07730 [Geobacteraceae bacterium GWF2_54_21]HBA73633.1 hypothetical protein [Geobacter sp.]